MFKHVITLTGLMVLGTTSFFVLPSPNLVHAQDATEPAAEAATEEAREEATEDPADVPTKDPVKGPAADVAKEPALDRPDTPIPPGGVADVKPAPPAKPISKADADALLAKLKTKINTKRTGKFAFTKDRYDKLEAVIPFLDRASISEADLIANSQLFAEGKLPENAYTLYLNEALKGYTAHIPRAAAAGNVTAMLQMALILEIECGKGIRPDLKPAVAMLEKAAAKGSVEAMLRIANYYRVGTGGYPRDYKQSAAWYEKAAAKKSPKALVRLAEYHFHGRQYAMDKTKANALIDEARSIATERAKKNDIESIFVLGYLAIDDGDMGLTKDPFAALGYFRRGVVLGDAQSMNSLAYLYNEGIGMTKKDPVKAVEWWTKAAELGRIEATMWLGNVYRHGTAVPRDFVAMHVHYREAALRGHALAMNEYGYCFDEPLGTKQDLAKALEWYKAGAAVNHPKATCNVGTVYYFNKGVPQDYVEAIKWWRKAAMLGDNDAMYKIGIAYRDGHGVEQSEEEHIAWYIRSARAGHEDAQKFLDTHKVKWRENSEPAPDRAPAPDPDRAPQEAPVPDGAAPEVPQSPDKR